MFLVESWPVLSLVSTPYCLYMLLLVRDLDSSTAALEPEPLWEKAQMGCRDRWAAGPPRVRVCFGMSGSSTQR